MIKYLFHLNIFIFISIVDTKKNGSGVDITIHEHHCTCGFGFYSIKILFIGGRHFAWEMALVQWRLAQFPRRLVNRCKEFTSWLILLRQTLFYNEFTSHMVALETAAEPLFWAVEKFSRYFGPVRLYFFIEYTSDYRIFSDFLPT